MCQIHNLTEEEADQLPSEVEAPESPFTESFKELYMLGVFSGLITTRALSLEHYDTTANYLLKGMDLGFSQSRAPITEGFLTLEKKVITNLFEFSAAKQYQQARLMSSMITPKMVFQEFKDIAGVVFDQYNNNWLKTEFVTATNQSLSAKEWQRIEELKEDFPLLKYRTQQDGRVRPEHVALNGTTLPVDDPFWDTYQPPNGFRCRCFTIQIPNGSGRVTKLPPRPKTDTLFKSNPGKTGELFDKSKHPYWEVPKGDKALMMRNFNLPINEK